MKKQFRKILALTMSILLVMSLFAGCGSQGEQGPVGPQGEAGANGVDGKSAYELAVENGYSGSVVEWLASLVGEVGAAGADGADGKSAYELAVENGYKGTQEQWLASLVGKQGASGADGVNGKNGKSAYELAVENGFEGSLSQWLDSLVGKDGVNGANGKDGKSAYDLAVDNGFEGTLTEWLASLVGKDGSAVEKGDKGDDGKSAYDLAVENGYTGDVQSWLASLVGAKGEKGDTGAQGAQGEKGDKGDTGAQGEKGDKGDKGDTGADGKDGVTPQLRINEDTLMWEISYDNGESWTSLNVLATGNKGDTGAQGEKGDKGDKGDTGAQGEKGDKGDKGDTGAQGAQGEKGDKGDKGDTGAQGEKGEKGDTGAQGAQGEKGEKGDTGAQGAQGEKGEKGDKGDTGAQGEKGDKGEKGDTGADGENGQSAYELYKKAHPEYTGSEQDWIEALANGTLTTYKVTFDLNGGTAPDGFQQTVTAYAGGYIALTLPTRTGFNFAGWYTGETVNDGIFTTTDTVSGNLNLIAKWTPVQVTVTFLDYYGDTVAVKTVSYGDAVGAPSVPSTIGKMRFVGWDKSVELNAVKADITVNAIYVADTYTVRYETNGGTEIAPEGVYVGEIPTKPEDPVKSGCSFVGWFMDREYQTEYLFDTALNVDTTLYAKFNGDYIIITTAEELAAIANDPAAKYMLANDINLKGGIWTPIDNFNGVLDGAGHKIFNFIIQEDSQYVGFVRKNSGTITNLVFDDFMLTMSRNASDTFMGIIVGKNDGAILNCTLTSGTFAVSTSNTRAADYNGRTYAASYYIGTVCGYNSENGTIVGINSDISIDATATCTGGYSYLNKYYSANYNYAGGIAGKNSGNMSKCKYSGKITVSASKTNGYNFVYLYIGAIVGLQSETGVVSECSVCSEITVNNKSSSNVNHIGSVCGDNLGKLTDCCADGKIIVSGTCENACLGGIVGANSNASVTSNCYSSVNIDATYIGGTFYAGGIVGTNGTNAAIKASVSTGSITADALTGYGYTVGYMTDGSTCFKCYYSDSAVITVADEVKTEGTCTAGVPKSLEECQGTDLLVDTLYWDTSIWIIGFGHPTLKAFMA